MWVSLCFSLSFSLSFSLCFIGGASVSNCFEVGPQIERAGKPQATTHSSRTTAHIFLAKQHTHTRTRTHTHRKSSSTWRGTHLTHRLQPPGVISSQRRRSPHIAYARTHARQKKRTQICLRSASKYYCMIVCLYAGQRRPAEKDWASSKPLLYSCIKCLIC